MFNRTTYSILYRWLITAIVSISFTLIWGQNLNAETRSKSASFNSTVPAQVWSGIKLSNMNEGAKLSVSGTSSDRLPVYLFSKLDDESFLPVDDAEVAVISDNTFSFDYLLPADGDYVLILDNRDGQKEVEYDIKTTVSIDLP
jgi:hypothetical protein